MAPRADGIGRIRQVGNKLWQNTFARGGLVFIGAATAVNLSNFVFHVVLSRLLGPSSYGALGALLNVTAVLTVPLAALQVTVTQSVAERPSGSDPPPLGRLLRISIVVGVVAVLVWTAATPTIDRFFHLTSPRPTVVLGLWLLPTVVGAVLQGVLIGERRFRVVAVSQLAGGLSRLALGVILIKVGLGVTGGVAATLIGGTVSCLLLLPPLRGQLQLHGTFVPRGKDAALSAVSLAGTTLLLGLDTWLARHFLAPLAAGYFAAAATAGRIALFLPGAITVIYFPQLAATGGVGPAARRALARCVALVALVSFGAAGAIVLLPSTVVDLLFGAAYVRSASAVGIVALADAAIAVSTCLVYYQVARRSRLALSAWPTCVFAGVLAALFHGSIVVLALDMLAAGVVFLIGLGVPTAVSVLRSLAEETSSLPRVAALLDDADLDLTVVVPFHNVGAERLRAHLVSVCNVLAETGASFEVVPVSDGSTDGSEHAVEDLSASLVRPIVFAENRGKGEALRIGLAHGRGRYLGFIDGDGDIPAAVLAGFVELARSQQPDMVVGSKRHPDSQVVYPVVRRFYSFCYQLLARGLFGLRARDTQTGIKLIRRDVLAEVLPRMVEKRYAFDLELLAVAHRLGYRQTAELPIQIGERFASTISPRIVWRMLQDTLATFYRMRVLRFYDPPLALPDGPLDGFARLQKGDALRILVCNWRDLAHPHAGGAEVYTHAVAREWVRRGHHVTWFTSAVTGRPSLEVADGVHIIRRGGRHTVYRQARRYFERQGQGRYDLVVDEVNTRSFGAAAWATGTPVVAVVHQVAREVWFHEVAWPVALLGRFFLEPRWLHRLGHTPVITLSESSRSSLQSYGIQNVWVVPPGQTPLERPTVERERVPTMVFVGRLASNKRPDHVLAAFRSVRRRLADAQLWIVGTGPLEEELRRGAPEGVTFFGRLSEDDKVDRLARAHALVATSVREGWGLNVSEAAQLGTPAVAYDVAGLRDSVSASGGLLVAPEPRALADALVEYLPLWVGGALPPIRCDSVAPWPEVADTLLTTAKESLAVAAEQTAREARADVAVAWRRALGPIGMVCDRRAWSVAGIAALIAVAPLEKIGATVWQGRLAGMAFVCFAIATIGALADAARVRPRNTDGAPVRADGRTEQRLTGSERIHDSSVDGPGRSVPRWLIPMLVVVVITAAAAQPWFAGEGAIAGGDIVPPVGTAWLAHLFSPWTWSGSNLGGPGQGALSLPWAAISAAVHTLGGSGALAQRIWLTGLFAGVGAGAVTLLVALGMGTTPTVAGALVYAFSSYIVANGATNDVYLDTMALVPALLAWVVTSARARQMRWWLVAMVPAAAMLGVVAENPTMLLGCAAVLLFGPVLVGWLYGRRVLISALRRTAAGIGVLVAASAYWAVPYVIQVLSSGAASVDAARSWTFTESRATLANGFWLNSFWGWSYSAYFPYAHWYEQFPLVFVKYLVPVAAFASLGLGGLRLIGRDASHLRLTAVVSAAALAIILLSTGTLFPGSFIFNLLYSLPYGWLLQEPNRFLFGTGLAYAILIAIGVEGSTAGLRAGAYRGRPGVTGGTVRARRRIRVAPIIGISVLILPGLPLLDGAVIPSSHSESPSHVVMPRYWETMATSINHSSPAGNLLVLPEDDFYAMPYTWYYGADTFITNMISRNVLDPSPQSYFAISNELLGAVGLFQQALLTHDWPQARALAQALGTRDLLVRGDIESSTSGRDIVDPAALTSSLAADPDIQLVDQIGPLDLFAFRRALGPLSHPVTINSSIPDLRLLSLLPSGSALVTSRPRPGVPDIVQLTSLANWSIQGSALATSVPIPPNRQYDIAVFSGPESGRLITVSSAASLGALEVRVQQTTSSARLLLSVPLGQDLIADGDFTDGKWGPVGNCDNADHLGTKAPIGAFVEPNGGPQGSPYLVLSAARDSACESTPVRWSSGPVVVSLMVRHVDGAPPRLCIWETFSSTQGQCATTAAVASTRTWTKYSTMVNPAAGTQSISLFLYGDNPAGSAQTVDDYADVHAYGLPASELPVAVVAKPTVSASPSFITNEATYSSHWSGPSGTTHVIVNGIVNGWIGTRPLPVGHTHYAFAWIVTGVELLSAVGASGLVLIIVGDAISRRFLRRQRQSRL